MSSTPPTNLWLERSRFNGMLLGSVSYGMFFTLTIEATLALLRQQRQQKSLLTTSRMVLLAYIAITFVLATIGFAGNAKYTQTIWIDMRDIPGGPPLLIELELDYWINRLALASYYIMEWFMEALLLYRCFVVWNKNPVVIGLMTTLFLASVAMSILVLTESKGAVFYNINVQLAYLCIAVGTNIIYTILVAGRIFTTRNQVRALVGDQLAEGYTSIIAMIIESAAMYSTLGILYIISFATNSNFSNLIFLAISHVQVSSFSQAIAVILASSMFIMEWQGIAQLLIILRVANGRAYTADMGSQPVSSMVFHSGPPHPPNSEPGASSTTEQGISMRTKQSTTSYLETRVSRESIDATM